MTLEQARSVARQAADERHIAFVIFRMPMWRSDVYGVLSAERGLPPNAEVVDTVKPLGTGLLF